MTDAREKLVYLVATEESGDRLGSALMRTLREKLGGNVRFAGVGGRTMAAEGLTTLFPIEELSIIGLAAVVKSLPLILRRLRETADAAVAARPDVVVLIDSPDFNLRLAKRIRARSKDLPVVAYVSPSVWAWRSGRAKAMRGSVDHVMALLPFEPEVHRRLGGPPCSYVGHPLIERLDVLRPNAEEAQRRNAQPPVLLALPGSRRSEIFHHMKIFGETLGQLRAGGAEFELVVPIMPHVEAAVLEAVKDWPVKPRVVIGEAEKTAAFRSARAALAKSGTVTLELAIAGVPMVAAYKAGAVEAWIITKIIRTSTVILANLVVGDNVVPEFIQNDCTAEKLAPALRDILLDTPRRQRQVDAFARLDTIMSTGGRTPSECAADMVLAAMR